MTGGTKWGTLGLGLCELAAFYGHYHSPYERGPSDILNQQRPKNHLLQLLLVATAEKKKP